MRQTKYLFIGGPLDQKWMGIGPESPSPVVSVMTGDRTRFGAIANLVNYYRQTALIPGWVVPLTVYRPDLFKIPAGTVLPGCVEGARPETYSIAEGAPARPSRIRWYADRLREAVQRENERRFQR